MKIVNQRVRRRLIAALSLVLSVVLLADTPVGVYAEENLAKSMKLMQIEGTVKVTDGSGKKLPTFAEMKLSDGYQIDTARASYAWINLDDTKAAKMNECSNADISKQDDDLELRMNRGDILLNVTEKIPKGSTLKIRSATTVMGITGTLIAFSVIDANHCRVILLEGSSEGRVTDPITGQTKTATIHGGQVADFYTYYPVKEGDKCEIKVRALTIDDIRGFIATELARDPAMALRVKAANLGLDLDAIIQNADGLLLLDRQTMDALLQEASASEVIADSVVPAFYEPHPVATHHSSHRHHRHHDDDDDDNSSSSSSNQSGGNSGGNNSNVCLMNPSGGPHVWNGHLDNLSVYPSTGYTFQATVTCQFCGATETNHEVQITFSNPKYFEWECNTCGASG